MTSLAGCLLPEVMGQGSTVIYGLAIVHLYSQFLFSDLGPHVIFSPQILSPVPYKGGYLINMCGMVKNGKRKGLKSSFCLL